MSFKSGLNRRSFLSTLGAATGSMFAPKAALAEKMSKDEKPGVDGHAIVPIKKGLGSTGNVYAELGVQPLVNIVGTVTVIGGSVMKPEVMEVMRQGNEHFVMINDLEAAAGKFIERVCKSPEGYTGLVTGGVAAGIVCAYAGMLTEDLEPRLLTVPDLTGFPKTEVIIQKGHRNAFDHQVRQTGVKLIEVETKEEMIAAINEKTLAIHFINIQSDRGQVSGPECIEIAKAHNIYTFNDASADVPPKERLWEYPAQGWDFVAFSAGKDICGPQAAGFLIGKKQLIHWAQMNMSPQEDRIGRACKVGKETLVAALKALEIFVDQDFDAVIKSYDERAMTITKAVEKFGVTALPRQFNPQALGNVTPYYSWQIDPSKLNITAQEVMHKLAETQPVGIGSLNADAGGMRGRNPNPPKDQPEHHRHPQDATKFGFVVWQLKQGEDKYIADRLVEIFSAAKKV
ncbi:MAG: L-seryl-tRNA selenium transferase [Edaphobacter sp.]|uniref:L-seryl-tRNA selenium transferase n=1 Tax=Edaphobacter sp. TaxID=1934404 RepID=UPI0023A491AC|nr:L-seryl-tRNA selenium transferase [Edaphobacter sp.]MDE1178714.1 L-seryl-tRNA selenium transferase [Edaphobacter sp.]